MGTSECWSAHGRTLVALTGFEDCAYSDSNIELRHWSCFGVRPKPTKLPRRSPAGTERQAEPTPKHYDPSV